MRIFEKILNLLFVTDYYAVQSDSGQYFVARDGNKNDLSISADKIEEALTADTGLVLGTYSTTRDNLCKWLVLDFDANVSPEMSLEEKQLETNKLRPIVREYYDKCLNLGLNPYVEFSGHKGYHIWVFFEEPISSEIAYKAANFIGEGMPGEIFPRQPFLRNGSSYGNLVKVPGCLNKKSGERSCWIDVFFNKYPDQLGFVDRIISSSRIKIESIADRYKKEIPTEEDRVLHLRKNFVVDYKHSLYEITDTNKRHNAQYPLVMKCFEAGMSREDILDLGETWLLEYRDRFKSSMSEALHDFENCVDYVASRCRVE